jgi:hypothetical protein
MREEAMAAQRLALQAPFAEANQPGGS